MSVKRGYRYIGTWLCILAQTSWIHVRMWMTITNIMLFVLAGVLVIGLNLWFGLRDLISAVLLWGLAEETLRIAWIAVSTYIKAKRMKDDLESDDAMQFWYGLVLSQTPRFLASVLAVSIAFGVHIGLEWRFFGTILTVIFIEVIAEKVFNFAVVLLVGVAAEKTKIKKRHKLPKEVKEVLAALDLAEESEFSKLIVTFGTAKEWAEQAILNEQKRVAHAIAVDKITPMNVAMVTIMEVTSDHLSTGEYHIRTGWLTPVGEEFLEIYYAATNWLLQNDLISGDEADKYKTSVRKQIADVG